MLSGEIKKLTVDGAELGYSVYGRAEHKPPIVFTHGYVMRSTQGPYEELLNLLARDYSVFALDLRGHGASAGAAAGFSFESLADDLVAFSQKFNLQQPVFVGHSFGAVIGLYAEIRHPKTFSAMCLLSPGPADHRRDPVDTLNFLIEHGHDKEALRGGFSRMFVRPPGPLLDVTIDSVTLVDASVHRAQQRQSPHFSIDDRLGDVSPPVLLLRGDSDTVVPPDKQHYMAQKLKRCKEVTFSSEGHMLPNESGPVAAGEILAFLEHDQAWMAQSPGKKQDPEH